MNTAETQIIDILDDLKTNYFVKAVKLEFEAEGTQLEEAIALKKFAENVGLNLTVKIGGCEAVRDIFDTKKLDAKTIIAPMIESPYALKKFVDAAENIFADEYIKLFINIETKTALENIDEIIHSKDFECIKGIILGRGDLACSMGMDRKNVNCEEIFDIAKNLSKKMKNCGKDFIVGGCVSPDSLSFFGGLPYLSGFETRKIVFDKNILKLNNADVGIIKAINFEIEWLKYKQKNFGLHYLKDLKRLEIFEKKYKKL